MELAILVTVGLPKEERIEAEAKIFLDVREHEVDFVPGSGRSQRDRSDGVSRRRTELRMSAVTTRRYP